MTTTEPKYAASAAREFLANCPEYVVSPSNWMILAQEIEKLVEEGYSPESVETYSEAFAIAKSKNLLMLNRTPPPDYPLATTLEYQSPEFFESLSKEDKERFGERISKLTPREIDSLPDHLARFIVVFEHRQKNKPPVLDEADKTLKPLFLEKGFEDSARNRAVIWGWLNKRSLQTTIPNLRAGITACADHLDLSPAAIELLSADEYRKRVIDPEEKKRRAKEAQKPKRERGNPAGFSYVSWLHGQ
jgi:hypothetical protein